MPPATPSQKAGAPVRRSKSGQSSFASQYSAPRVSAFSVMIESCSRYPRTRRMPIPAGNSFGTRDKLNVGAQSFQIHRLELLEKKIHCNLAILPFSLRILLENLL